MGARVLILCGLEESCERGREVEKKFDFAWTGMIRGERCDVKRESRERDDVFKRGVTRVNGRIVGVALGIGFVAVLLWQLFGIFLGCGGYLAWSLSCGVVQS